MTKRTQVKMYREIVEILRFVEAMCVFSIAVIERTTERYANEWTETRTPEERKSGIP